MICIPENNVKKKDDCFLCVLLVLYMYMSAGRQTRQNLGGGVAEVTKIDATTWVHFYKGQILKCPLFSISTQSANVWCNALYLLHK